MEPNDAGGDADQHNDEEYKPLMGCVPASEGEGKGTGEQR